MVGEPKLNLVLMDQMKNDKHNGRGSIGKLQEMHEEARKDGSPPNHICKMLVRYKDVFTSVLLKMLPPTSGKQLCSSRYWVLKVCGDKWSWWMNMKNVKAIQEENWPLTLKKLRLSDSLANYFHHFIRHFSKANRTLVNLLKEWLSQEWDEFSLPPVLKFAEFAKFF